MRSIVCIAVLSLSAHVAVAGPEKEVNFDEEEIGESITVAPLPDEDRESLMPRRYVRENEPAQSTEKLPDPMPMAPKKHGCGACTASGTNSSLWLAFVFLAAIGLIRRSPRSR